jgi:hypothetical protein
MHGELSFSFVFHNSCIYFQVALFSPLRFSHYLDITLSNLVKVHVLVFTISKLLLGAYYYWLLVRLIGFYSSPPLLGI